MNSNKELDILFEKIRALEQGGKKDPVMDNLFKRLRKLERRSEEMEKLKWQLIGAIGAVTIIAQIASKILLKE
jgi:hypothetical protein